MTDNNQQSQAPKQKEDATTTQSGTGFQPVTDINAPLTFQRGAYLPHLTREGGTYAVSFRLADSLPREVLLEYQIQREALIASLSQNAVPTPLESRAFQKLFSEKIDTYLDSGSGACYMKDPAIAGIVAGALNFFDGQRYQLYAWCVMPNHVHAVLRPLAGNPLKSIMHTWKSFTANQANKRLSRTGTFWQPEPYDHLIRDEGDFNHSVDYVLRNPTVAGLKNWPWVGTCVGRD